MVTAAWAEALWAVAMKSPATIAISPRCLSVFIDVPLNVKSRQLSACITYRLQLHV
jgi:hypothetical protein